MNQIMGILLVFLYFMVNGTPDTETSKLIWNIVIFLSILGVLIDTFRKPKDNSQNGLDT